MPRLSHSLTMTVVLFVLAGCSASDAGQPVSWKEIELAGKTLELIDEKRIESYRFEPDNLVEATLGEKSGALTGPTLYWKINDQVLLLSEDKDFKNSDKYSTPLVNNDVLTVRTLIFSQSQYRLSLSK